MQTLESSSRARQRTLIFRAACLFVPGLAGMISGGPIWGFLGVTLIMVAVWMTSFALQLTELSREIEQSYRPSRQFIPAPLSVPQRLPLAKRSRHLM